MEHPKTSLEQLKKSLEHLKTSLEHLKTSLEHLKTSDIILRKMSAQGVIIHKSYNPAENIEKQLRTTENI